MPEFDAPAALGAGLREQLGEILVRKGTIDREQLEVALAGSQAAGLRLGEYLTREGILIEDEIAQALADQYGLPYATIDHRVIDRAAARLIPERLARSLSVVALRASEESVTVAVADPTNVFATDELKIVLNRPLRIVVAELSAIKTALDEIYSAAWSSTDAGQNDVVIELVSEISSIDEDSSVESAPAIEVVNSVLRRSIGLRASDIHLIPRRDDLLVRVRVDGVMRDLSTIPYEYKSAVAARLKVMGKLDIAEKRLPQDGRASVMFGDAQTDLRVAILPSQFGEDIVVRVQYLDASAGTREISDLGLDGQTAAVFTHALRQPNGAILLCGPTGSGKTATLYAALRALNDGSRSIVTIEDPVEATLDNTVQIQVNEKAGLTFARGLRTILRADPDVILIGEVRDLETAGIAMQAAMTGHLVLSSIHAQSAPAALARLRDMGLASALVNSAVSCIVAQRLVRRPCSQCAHGTLIPEQHLAVAGLPADTVLYRPRGCASCSRTGYSGRMAVYESFLVDDEIRTAAESGSAAEITAAVRRAGMNSLRDNALALCFAGLTTLDEVNRVCGGGAAPRWAEALGG
jgi:type IV pilus assembly protein PilB